MSDVTPEMLDEWERMHHRHEFSNYIGCGECSLPWPCITTMSIAALREAWQRAAEAERERDELRADVAALREACVVRAGSRRMRCLICVETIWPTGQPEIHKADCPVARERLEGER